MSAPPGVAPTLHCRRFGPPGQPLLLIHCSLGHSGTWAPLAAVLPDRPALAFDLPGHGRSPDWPGRPALHDLCTRAAQEIAAAEGAPLDLLGHSFGATVALRMALEHPGRLRSLTLVEPVLFAALPPAEAAAARAAEDGVGAALAAGDRRAAARAFLDRWGGPGGWAALDAAQQARMAARIHLIPAGAAALWDDAAGLLRPGRLEGLRVPVLLVSGGASPPAMARICDRLAARLPAAQRCHIASAGHMLPVTHAPELAARLRRFLAAGPDGPAV